MLMEHSGLLPQLRGMKVNSTCSDFAWPGCWVPKVHKQLPKILLDSGWGIQHCINWMLVHLRTKKKGKQHSGASLQFRCISAGWNTTCRIKMIWIPPQILFFFPNSLIKSWLKTQTFCHPYYRTSSPNSPDWMRANAAASVWSIIARTRGTN